MHTTCTWRPARRLPGPIRAGHDVVARCGARFPRPTALDAVLRQVTGGQPMTVAELRHAAGLLARHLQPGRTDVLVARVRVAVRLEQQGA